MKGKKAKRIAQVDSHALSVKPIVRVVDRKIKGKLNKGGFIKALGESEDGNIKRVEENGREKPKNIGIVFPSGKKVKLTNFPFRTETVYLEIKNKFPLTVWHELNDLYAQHISQLAAYKLERVRDFIQSKGKGKLVAYRKEKPTEKKTEKVSQW